MKKTYLLACALACMIIAAALLGAREGQVLRADCQPRPSSLEGKSNSEIESAAREYLCANFKFVGSAPIVRLNRKTSPREYMSFFGGTQALCEDQNLAMVVFEGDFERVDVFAATAKPIRAKFVGLLFDLKLGVPTSIDFSSTGEGFREILKDASLPEKKTAVSAAPQTLRKCAYGQIAPTVMPPLN